MRTPTEVPTEPPTEPGIVVIDGQPRDVRGANYSLDAIDSKLQRLASEREAILDAIGGGNLVAISVCRERIGYIDMILQGGSSAMRRELEIDRDGYQKRGNAEQIVDSLNTDIAALDGDETAKKALISEKAKLLGDIALARAWDARHKEVDVLDAQINRGRAIRFERQRWEEQTTGIGE